MRQYQSGKVKDKKESLESQVLPRNKYYNLYTIVAFLAGALVVSILSSTLSLFEDFTPTNSIELFSIFINIFVGFLLYLVIDKKTGDDRVVKNIFQEELSDIKADYKNFLTKINGGQYEAKDITKWFKLMSIKITHFEYFLRQEFKFHQDECTLQKMNRNIQKAITNSKEFNESFQKGKVRLTSETTSSIIELNKELKHNFTRTAVKISRA